ncbi:hypothetical protein ACH4S8_22210 [Streptomyces sp. NPDC021080]|uniref:hypothetical protein n=1 Tax=Streptomyces sp. NPDC021080 TaxID=3365110 RepID=UPI0037AB13B3
MSARSQYFQAHRRVDDARGKARTHVCNWCGKAANHWAYDWADPNQHEVEDYVWSSDPLHYIPLCARDHALFDRARIRVGLAGLDAAIAPLKAEAARRLTEEQKAWHAGQCERQSLINDTANAIASRAKFAKIDARRDEERAKQKREWSRAITPLDTLCGYFPVMAVLGDESHRMTGADAYALYEEWSEAESFTRRLTRSQFYAALGSIPYVTRKRTRNGTEFIGIRPTTGL